MKSGLLGGIRYGTGLGRLARRNFGTVPRLEQLEDRLVLSGPGTWSAFNPSGPAPRWGAPIVALGPLSTGGTFKTLGSNYFFGGTDGTTTFGDTWAITQSTVLATQMQPPTSPPARHDQAAVAFNNEMYIFGGENAAGDSLSDVWAFDPLSDTWQQQPSQSGPGAWPGAFDAVAGVIGQQIILYGGSVSSGGTTQAADAFAYAYNPSNGAWTQLAADPMGSDTGATAAAFGGKLYVFSSTSKILEIFDPVQNTWSLLSQHGSVPAPRAYAAGAALSNIFWLTGGAGSSGDTWEYNFTTSTWTQKASFPDAGVQNQGGAAFFNFGVPAFMVYGGQVGDPVSHLPVPDTDAVVGRFQGVGGVVAVDNFPAGLPNLVVPHAVVAEPGGTLTYEVELGGTTVSDTVTIPLSSTNPAEGTVSPSELVFTPANANTPQTITITGGSDTTLSGDLLYQIQYGPIVSADPDWNGLTESLPVIARDVPTFTVGTQGSYAITTHGYTVTPVAGSLPSWLNFDSTSNTISGTPPVGSARTYALSFQGEAASTMVSFNLVVANALTAAPTLTNGPADQTVNAGQTATFTAAASGSPPPSVQWQISTDQGVTFTDIPGASSTTLNVVATGAMTGDRFRALFTNTAGQATSGAAILIVKNFAPIIESQPTSVSVKAGSTARFTVVEIADPAATIQWQKAKKGSSKFKSIRGATSTTLAIVATTAKKGQKFRAVITNEFGTVTSATALLSVVKAKRKR
jgi:hypothetical protein